MSINREQYERDLAERQRRHLECVRGGSELNWQPCMHDNCPECHGTGVKSNGPCVFMDFHVRALNVRPPAKMNTITVTDKDTGLPVKLTQLRHRVLKAQGALRNYYPDAPMDWPEDSTDINKAPMSDRELLDWAESIICNAVPMSHCSQKEWDEMVKKWRDCKHGIKP